MSELTLEQVAAYDGDPWMSFGPFSDSDISAVRRLLEQAAVTFYVVTDDPSATAHRVWVHDDHIARTEAILVPYFQTRKDEGNA